VTQKHREPRIYVLAVSEGQRMQNH